MNFPFFTMFPYNNPYSHHIYFPGLIDAARRPTGTPAGESREKAGQLRPTHNTCARVKNRRSCSVIGTICIATIFNGYIKLCESQPFIGNLPVQFSYENETHPLRKHMLHQFGLRPN